MYLAEWACVLHRTGAVKASQAVCAGASILAWLRITLINFVLAEGASKTRTTSTGESVYPIHTCAVIQTRAAERERINELLLLLLFIVIYTSPSVIR